MKITALMDNLAAENKAVTAEHGLSLFFEGDGFRVLFDSGQSALTMQNAESLGIDLRKVDTVVLSHSHYDHARGLRHMLDAGLAGHRLIVGEHFFEKKYAGTGDEASDLSCGFDREYLKEKGIEVLTCSDCLEVAPGLWAVGNFPRVNAFEIIPARFTKAPGTFSADGRPVLVPDDFSDEICLAAETPDGLCVFVGCSHPGIVNIIRHVHKRLGKQVIGVYGGTHLKDADDARIYRTVRLLKEMGLKTIGFSHCSGTRAEEIAAEDPDVTSCHLAAGEVLVLPD